MVEIVHIQAWNVIFWRFAIQLVKWAFFAWNWFLLILGFFVFGKNSVFGVAVVFDFTWSLTKLSGDLLIDDWVYEIRLFDWLNSPCFFLLVKIDRVFHQLIQLFNLLNLKSLIKYHFNQSMQWYSNPLKKIVIVKS